MRPDLFHQAAKGLRRAARQQSSVGHKKNGTGLGMIAFGILLLPIPIIGIPLIIAGICTLFS
jgi:hypothetical protein